MVAVNELRSSNPQKKEILEPLVILLSPFAPFLAEELFHLLGNTTSVHLQTFPTLEEKYLVEAEIIYPISINGKKRTEAAFATDASKEDIEAKAIALEAVQKWIDGKTIRKVIVVPKRMVNIVVG